VYDDTITAAAAAEHSCYRSAWTAMIRATVLVGADWQLPTTSHWRPRPNDLLFSASQLQTPPSVLRTTNAKIENSAAALHYVSKVQCWWRS